jgi:tetratricopeptide (TPR) repeat protein
VDGTLNVTVGIRIYDPKRRDVLDEEIYQRAHHWEASAANLSTAMASLINKADATRYLGREVGVDYACKISPMPTRVSRTFYGKSKHVPEMEVGGRHADIADWEGAIELWKQGLTRAPAKEAGQLCFNIAVAYEVLSDWENARVWAEKSYVVYGNDQAHAYLGELRYRVRQESIASQQLQQAAK